MRVLVTGGNGMLGSHLVDEFNFLNIDYLAPARSEVDLKDYFQLNNYININKPTHVIHCAAKVGGILDNINKPTQYILENSLQDSNLFYSCVENKIENFLYMSSSCVYPENAPRPFLEGSLFTGKPEETNLSYAQAKLTGMQISNSISNQYGWNYKSLVLSNLYGPRDNFNPESSHLLASIIRKIHIAKKIGFEEIEILGTGNPRREFTYVRDVAKWITSTLTKFSELPQSINLGAGYDYSIKEYYQIAAETLGFKGKFYFNEDVPDGIGSKLMDSSVAKKYFGWEPNTTLSDGILTTYKNAVINNEI